MPIARSPIHGIPLFASVPPEELDGLAVLLREVVHPVGSVLFHEGEHGETFFIVLDGSIEIVKALGSEEERSVGIRRPGEFVGEMSLLSRDGLRTATVRVLEQARMLELSRADFDALLRRYPQMAHEMLRVLSGLLQASNDATIRDLHEKNQLLAKAYTELKTAQARIIEQEVIVRELQMARGIQQSMLPSPLPKLEGFDLGACMLPARVVGGDFFDIIPLDEASLGIAVGDVSGKGIPAALFMALASNLLRAEVTRGVSPEHALQALNRHLLSRNATGMFVTLLYGVLRRDSRTFHYVRAGHEFPLVWEHGGRRIVQPQLGSLPLGLFPEPVLDVQTMTIPERGTLLLYTDGVVEAINEQDQQFGRDHLFKFASAQRNESAQALCDEILQSVLAHHGAAPQSDDITLLAVRA